MESKEHEADLLLSVVLNYTSRTEDLPHVLYFPTGVEEQLDLLRVEHANVTLASQANMSGGEKCTSTVLQ